MLKLSSAAMILSLLASTGAYAAEENLEFKLVVKPLEVKMLEAPNIPGQHQSVVWAGPGVTIKGGLQIRFAAM